MWKDVWNDLPDYQNFAVRIRKINNSWYLKV